LPDGVAADYGGVAGPDWYEGAAARIAAQADGADWVAVLHSGAGGFAPAIAATARRLTGFVFMDAVLPYPGRSWLQTAPPALAARLHELASDSLLAPWDQWFGDVAMERLLPEPAARAAFVTGLPRVPTAFLEAPSPDLKQWVLAPAAYLRLSEAYEPEAAEAERRGWPTTRARAHHLATVSDPAKVAALLTQLSSSFAAR
jgi:hypothetical protein